MENTRQSAARISHAITEYRQELAGHVVMLIRQNSSTYASTGRTKHTTKLWVDAPAR
jgi:hypothetical protein